MAGNAKPNVPNLGKEGKWTILGESLAYPVPASGLFSGASETGWLQGTAAWTNDSHYLKIKLHQSSRIWRTGYRNTNAYYGKLRIYRENSDGTRVKISDGLPVTEAYYSLQWELFTDILPAGVYIFTEPHSDPSGYGRIDSEWYIEAMESNSFLFEKDNDIYTFRNGILENLGGITPTAETFETNGVENVTQENLLELKEALGQVRFLYQTI